MQNSGLGGEAGGGGGMVEPATIIMGMKFSHLQRGGLI